MRRGKKKAFGVGARTLNIFINKRTLRSSQRTGRRPADFATFAEPRKRVRIVNICFDE